ncbi:MAG: patatin-like phospholipase family protein [Pseudomonadales bacterium]|nr:patatin-like phospholipase family protein [Pseudomonadales bacterium]
MIESAPPIKRALILSGGGGRGAYQVGVWRRLQEIGWQPDMVCGTSIGSINGALIGSGWDAGQLEAFWTSLDRKRAFRVSLWRRIKYRINRLLGRHPDFPALLDNEPLRQTLSEAIDVGRLRDDQPTVTVAATNVCRARLEYFSGEQLSVDHLVASCSIPVVFPWCEIDGELYWDGGVMANTPIFPALDAGATEILVVLLAPLAGDPVAPPKTTGAAFSWAFDMITIGSAGSLLQELASHLGRDIRAGRESLASQHFMDLGDIRIGVVAPKTAWGMDSILDLDPQRISARIAAGYDDATEQLTGFLQQSMA